MVETKRIKHISELPCWFKLSKYEFTKHLDALGWYKHLITRCLHYTKAGKISEKTSIDPDHEQTLKKTIPLIRQNPNLFIDDQIVLSSYHQIHGGTPEDNPKTIEQILGVHRIKSKKEIKEAKFDIYQVNYNFSDEFLIENFKQCLAITRKKLRSSFRAPYEKSDFRNWAKLGILPFIDLYMWSLEVKKHITHRVLAYALYPDGFKGGETIRKTTFPLLEEIISRYSMVQLHAQAATVIQEKKFR